MSLFGDIGNFFGSLFNEDQKKKQQQAAQQQPVVNHFAQPQQPQQNATVQAPKPFFQSPSLSGNQAPQLGGVITNQPQTPPVQAASSPVDSFLHGVGNVVGGLVHSPVELAKYAAYTPETVVRELQNKPVNDIQEHLFGTTNGGDIAKQIIGNTASTALLAAGPTIDSGAGALGAKFIPDTVHDLVSNTIPKVVGNAAIGGGLNAASTYTNGGNFDDVIKSLGTGALYGGGLGLTGAVAPLALRGIGNRLLPGVETTLEDSNAIKPTVNEIPPLVTRPATEEPTIPVSTPRDPESPITSSPTTSKPPAITSPNRAVSVAPTKSLVAETPIDVTPPTVGGVEPLQVAPVPVAKPVAAPAPTADEQTAAIQAAIDKQAATPESQPAEVATAPAEAPAVTEAKSVAAQSPVVNPEEVAQAVDAAKAADAPTQASPTTEPTTDLGTIAKDAVSKGLVKSDADAQAVASQVEDAINAEAKKAGSTWEKINKKLQSAPKDSTDAEAGLTPAEANVARKAAEEAAFVRNRIDPSLLGGGQVKGIYAPRQALNEAGESQDYTPKLVNELRRSKTNPVPVSELDHSTTPYNHLIRRYLNAADAGTSRMADMVESDAEGKSTGVTLSDQAKTDIHDYMQKVADSHDEAMRATERGDTVAANKAVDAGDSAMNDAIKRAAKDVPKNVANHQKIVNGLTDMRDAYNQTLMRTLGFSNVVNRLADQAQKGTIVMTNKALPIANKVAAGIVKRATVDDASLMGTGRDAGKLARQYSKGTLKNQLNRNFKTSVSLAGAGRNPLIKGLAKTDAVIRGIGTYATGAGDLTTEASRIANLKILGDAQEAGITDKLGMEQYLRSKLGTQEYKEAYDRSEGTLAGYIGMPHARAGIDSTSGKISNALSKNIDNAITNVLTKNGVPNRVARELNDTVMPTLSGFSGATSRIGAKAMNAVAFGIPQIRAAINLAKTDMPGATEQAQLMIARSLIDTVSAGGVAAAGLLLGSHAHWTGPYPSDPNEQARWNHDGTTADSFEFDAGGKKLYFQPGRFLGALAIPLNAAAAVGSKQNVGDAVGDTVNQFVDNLGGSSIIEHIGDLNNLLNGNASDKAQAAKNLQNSLVPSTGLVANIANFTDNTKRKANNAGETLESRIPGLRENLAPATDSRGNPLPNGRQVSGGSALLTVGQNSTNSANAVADPVDAEIERLAGKGHEVTPTTSATNASNSNTQGLAQTLLADPIYSSANDKDKASMLKTVLAGTSTKDISTSIPSSAQQALLDAKLLGSTKSKVWLQDNDNNFNYQTATYANKKANGTLTSDDQDINKTGSLAQKVAIAGVNKEDNVSQDLVLGYADTSKTEFNKLPDGSKAKDELIAYDQALAKAGLPSKYTNKYGSYGSTSGGGRASKAFTFASLPSSLIGTNASSSNGYAKAAPLFTPIADLQAPPTVAIPKGRTISVKQGVQV